jgi:hypothetical protein
MCKSQVLMARALLTEAVLVADSMAQLWLKS